jgi:hypothetical protein
MFSLQEVRRLEAASPLEQDVVGRRVDAVHQRIQLHLAEVCPHEDPRVLMGALGYELVRLMQMIKPGWTPEDFDRFLIDFTNLLRRRVSRSH